MRMTWLIPCLFAALTGCDDKNDTGDPTSGASDDTALTDPGDGGPSGPGAGGSDPGAGETGALIGMTEAHNAVRAEEAIAPLSWSSALARDAQDWADSLSETSCSFLSGGTEAGDSLFVGYPIGGFTAAEVVAEWAEEGAYYDYDDDLCEPPTSGQTCVHYLQIVWAETERLGCGMAACVDGWEVWACIYDPPGNTGGQPY